MKKFLLFGIIMLGFMCLCGNVQAQYLPAFSGMAKVTPQNGPTTYYAATVESRSLYGNLLVKLFSENYLTYMPGAQFQGPVRVTVALCYPSFYSGTQLTARYCLTITAANSFVATIVPNSLEGHQLLAAYQGTWYTTSAWMHPFYPVMCSGAMALFNAQVPCQADGAIELDLTERYPR